MQIIETRVLLFDSVEHQVGIAYIEASMQVLRHRDQFHLFNSPYLETGAVSSLLELFMVKPHV